ARTSSNAEQSATAATVTITVNGVNDVPEVQDITLATDEDLDLTGTLTATDAEGDALTFEEGATAATNGTVVVNPDGTFTSTPTADFSGTGTFSFIANDGSGDSTEATVTVTINALNDVPEVLDVALSTDEDLALTGTLTGTDAEGGPLTFEEGATAAV